MINITCANGITTVVNTDYNVMPVVKFVNPVGSYISQAKGMYNGHYYWALDGVAAYGSFPGTGTIYIWFKTGNTEWWATDALGGGLLYDSIQSPTNTLYPLEAFAGGSFDAGTLISPANGLAKSYFNINGKFHTKETTFYVYLANDVYEIPLAKLQVNGSPQATMQDGINALATILVNAGSSGGGGVTNYWDLTFAADDGVNLNLNGFIATYPGVYIIIGAGDGTYVFEAPAASSYPGQTMTIVNVDSVNAYIGSGNTTIQYADAGSLVQLPSLTSVVLVSGNSANIWWVVSQYTV
jgi:hypothetical protein